MATTVHFWSDPGDRDGRLGPWNTARIDGKTFPGQDVIQGPGLGVQGQDYDAPGTCAVEVHGAKSAYRSDKFSDTEKSKHTTVKKGPKPSSFELVIRMWTEAQWNAYEAILPSFNPRLKENQEKAHNIQHMDLQGLGITSFYVEEIGQLEPVNGSHDERAARWKCWEVFEGTKKATGKKIKADEKYSKVGLRDPFRVPDGPNAS